MSLTGNDSLSRDLDWLHNSKEVKMVRLRPKFLETVFTIALLIGLTHSTSAQEKIRLSYSALSPSTAFLWIPREKAFFKKHGLDAEIILIESGTLTSQALASGEIGIADNAGAPAIISNASGSGETIIMGLVNSLEYNMVSTKQVKNLADLKGKRIGVSRIGSSSHAAAEIALDHFKIDDAYKSLRGYALNIRKPYPTNEGVNSLINFLAKFNPKVAKLTAQDVVDASLVGELEKNGFIDAVYKEAAQGR